MRGSLSLKCFVCEITRQTCVIHLEDVFRLRLQKTSSRRLDQDEYIRLSLTSLEDVFKTSWSRPIYFSWPHVFKTSQTSSRRFQDVFKTSYKNVFKTSSSHLQHVLQRYLQEVFKIYHQVKLFLLTRLREVFNTFLRRYFPKTVFVFSSAEGFAQVALLLRSSWPVSKICKRRKNFSSFSSSLY